jgi:tRNA A37 threonylcarbamoyladenosine modification protein TsaB
MTYHFQLKITKEKSRFSLFCGNEKMTSVEWPEGRDMGRRLFEAMEKLLAENNLKPEQVNDFTIDSEMPENYTSARIAETIKKTYVFGTMSSRPSLRVEGSCL